MAQAVPSKLARARAQASHSHAPRTEQHAPVIQPAPLAQPTPTTQPAPVAQPTLMASQVAQVDSTLSQPSRPIIEPVAFTPHFSVNLTFPNSNLIPGVYYPSTTQ
ncbi:hypothetical protein FF2_018274 [Malus domestica]